MARFEERLVLLNKQLVALTLGAVFIIVFINVLGRYLLGVSLPWAEEVARHLMIFGAFAGAGLALREGRLVSIDTLLDALPHGGAARRLIRWGTVIVMAVFMALLIWFGAQFVSFGWNKETMATQVPRGIPYLAIPIGAAIFLIHLALFARRFVAGTFEYSGDGEGV
ncbi:MAG: TRAP transporter small permease [Paracoccaceae bacterium]